MQARYTISHAKYTGSTSSDGYPSGDQWAAAVNRTVYAIYPLSSQMNMAADYDRRVITSKVLMVPDIAPYSPRDKVVLPGGDAYFVSEDVRDYSNGPFGFKPSSDAGAFGEVIVEKVTG